MSKFLLSENENTFIDEVNLLRKEWDNLNVLYNESVLNQNFISLKKLVNENETTYSPLALYFLIDNNLIDNRNEINDLFDELINETILDEEIKNLIIYKKALFNSGYSSENDLLKMLNPIINSESVWRSHALQLLAEYFYSKNEKEKAKKIYKEILSLKKIIGRLTLHMMGIIKNITLHMKG